MKKKEESKYLLWCYSDGEFTTTESLTKSELMEEIKEESYSRNEPLEDFEVYEVKKSKLRINQKIELK